MTTNRAAIHKAIALGVFISLAILHTWPLSSNPAHLSRNDTADTLLNTWAIAWVAHQLPRDPRHLFDATILFVAILLFALDALLISRRAQHAVLLGVAFALQALASIYVFVFTIWLLLFLTAARAREWIRRDPVRALVLLFVAAGIAAVCLAPYLTAYAEVHQAQGFERSVDDARVYSGSWMDYLSTGSRLYYPLWGEGFFYKTVSCTFPGLTCAALFVLAGVWPETRRNPRVRMCFFAGAGCAALSMLPAAPFYPWLHQHILLFRIVRIPARLGQIVLLMMAVVAAFGLTGLLQRCSPVVGAVIAVGAAILVNVEVLRARMPPPGPRSSRSSRRIATSPSIGSGDRP